MLSKHVLSLFGFFCLVFHTSNVAATCPVSGCDITGPVIRFPFQLNSSVDNSCGYPSFGLSCSKTNQTITNLPGSGEFLVTYINYHLQSLYINDPDNCLPKRLQNFTLDNTPFEIGSFKKFLLLNCSTNFMPQVIPQSRPVPCLDDVGRNRTVVSVPEDVYGYYATPLCSSMSTIWAPVKDRNSVDISDDIVLRWRYPTCWRCEQRGGVCGLKDEKTLEIGCYYIPSNGDSKSSEYRIIIGILVPGCLCIVLLICYYCSRARTYNRRHDVNTEISVWPSVTEHPIVERGLDVQTLESYPKTQLGESKRLPNPGQNTCAICLSEYKPKETLKTLPECNHFFHAQCIDQWLKMNSTCPLCRNSPARSSQGTPSSMFSFTSSSSVSPIS